MIIYNNNNSNNVCVEFNGCVIRNNHVLYCTNDNVVLPCKGVVGLIGDNGSGKTTTLETWIGLTCCIRGYLRVVRPVAYMPEEHFSPIMARVREWFWLHNIGLERVANIGFPQELLNEKISRLSHGWRRFAELIAVMFSRARIYMLDEPFSGMDSEKIEKAWDVIQSIGERRLVIITSHSVDSVKGVAERVLSISPKGVMTVETL